MSAPVLLVLFAINALILPAFQSSIPVLSLAKIEHHVMYNQWTEPLCIVFSHKKRTLPPSKQPQKLHIIQREILKLRDRMSFSKWKFGKFYLQEHHSSQLSLPASDGLLRCYIGTAVPHDFDSTASIRKWMKELRKIHKGRIEVQQSENLETLFEEDLLSRFFIVILPGSNFFEAIEPCLYKVRKSCDGCRIFIAPPESPLQRMLSDKSALQTYPAALIFHREKDRMAPKLKKTLEGLYIFTKEHFLLHMTVLHSNARILTLETFEIFTKSVRIDKRPRIICFYSSSNTASYKILHALGRSVLYLSKEQNAVEFGLVDLALTENSKIISRHLDITSLKKIPFIAVFWSAQSEANGYSTNEVNQTIVNDLVPTPSNVLVLLRDMRILPNEGKSAIHEKFCWPNITVDVCQPEEKPGVLFGPEFNKDFLPKKKIQKLKPMMKTLMGMPVITDKLWPRVIEQVTPTTKSILPDSSSFTNAARVKLVIFIMADCGYCEIMMQSFSNLTKAAKRLYGTTVYLMNCTSDPVNCKRNGVTGYPTLALFRSVSEEESKSCLLPNSTSSSVRLDYHGNMQTDAILSWLSKAGKSSVQNIWKSEKLNSLSKEVRLTAYVYTKALARKYLSRSLQQKVVPFQCFKLACEKLFGTVECLAQPSMDVISDKIWAGKVKDRELVLDQVKFERRDGVSTTVFKLSYPMENTIERGHDVKLHKFHRKHRYNIPSGFRCEDNHPLCTEILVKFVEDHQRLPVTHISQESFHAHGTSASIFSKEFPVLIALAHKENISTNSTFLKELEKAAQILYTKVIVATLNVDEFPSWASQFVPKDYHYNHHETFDKIPALYHYPRLCIIEWDDHQHAAFYPPIDELERNEDVKRVLSKVSASSIIDFAEKYLQSKDRVVLETEMF